MILNDTVATKADWISLRGKILDGGYELGDVLEAKDSVAHFRARVLGDSSIAAYASFYIAEGTSASEQLQIWQDLCRLKHPNLKTPIACGRFKSNETSAIYVVCGMPDETLSEILGARGLTDEEGRELLKNLGQGLLYLHSHGFAHGALSPEMAVAVGEAIQISTECTRRINSCPKVEISSPCYLAPEVTSANVSMAADIWCLGATVFESMVQKKYEKAWFGDLERLGLGHTLQRCLDSNPQTRARLSQLLEPLDTARNEATLVSPSSRLKPVEMELVRFDSTSGSNRAQARGKSKSGVWAPAVAGVSALVLLAVVIWLLILPKFRSIPDPSAGENQQAKSAWQTRTIGTVDGKRATNPTQGAPVAGTPAPTWRFVISNYEYERDADRRIQFLNKIHPDLDVKEFSTSPAGPFYVVAGPPMDRSDATELRKRALKMGIARTSYISDFGK